MNIVTYIKQLLGFPGYTYTSWLPSFISGKTINVQCDKFEWKLNSGLK